MTRRAAVLDRHTRRARYVNSRGFYRGRGHTGYWDGAWARDAVPRPLHRPRGAGRTRRADRPGAHRPGRAAAAGRACPRPGGLAPTPTSCCSPTCTATTCTCPRCACCRGAARVVVPRGRRGVAAGARASRGVEELAPGEALVDGDLRVTGVPGRAQRPPLGPALRRAARRRAAMGHLLRDAGDVRVYAAGDTDLFDGMAELPRPGRRAAAGVGLGARRWGPATSTRCGPPRRCGRLRPRVAVPVHWGTLRARRADRACPAGRAPACAGCWSTRRTSSRRRWRRGRRPRRSRSREPGDAGSRLPVRDGGPASLAARLDRPGRHRLPGAGRRACCSGRSCRWCRPARWSARPPRSPPPPATSRCPLVVAAGHGGGADRRPRHVRGRAGGQRGARCAG